MPDAFSVNDNIIFQEMMAHPAIFSHVHPKKIALVGDSCGDILQEIIKHSSLSTIVHITNQITEQKTEDKRIEVCTDLDSWMTSTQPDSFDVLIVAEDAITAHFNTFFNLLHPDGTLIQQTVSPFHVATLKTLQQQISAAGFRDIHFLSFPQPHYPSGWRTAILAKKLGNLRRIREKDIFNKNFSTRYYNYDVHKAALVLPEFMREELEPYTE